jgi:uncharacterized protein (DUF433 family)
MANREDVERRNGGYYVAGTRVSLDSIVYAFLSGDSAEMIQKSFSTLRLEEVYGGIAFYLANQSEVDEYLVSAEKEYARLQNEASHAAPRPDSSPPDKSAIGWPIEVIFSYICPRTASISSSSARNAVSFLSWAWSETSSATRYRRAGKLSFARRRPL